MHSEGELIEFHIMGSKSSYSIFPETYSSLKSKSGKSFQHLEQLVHPSYNKSQINKKLFFDERKSFNPAK